MNEQKLLWKVYYSLIIPENTEGCLAPASFCLRLCASTEIVQHSSIRYSHMNVYNNLGSGTCNFPSNHTLAEWPYF